MKEGKTMKKVQKMLCSLMVILLLAGGVIPTNNSVITPAITVEAAVSKKQTAKFVRAIDGDTAELKVKGKIYTFRFLAVDTPETKKPNTPVAFMGKRASNYTKTALKKAKKIQIQYDGAKTDKYGRRLAWVWIDGKLLQKQLVQKGYARVYYIYGNYKYTKTLQSAEKVARKKKLGVWKNYNAAFPDGNSSSGSSNKSNASTEQTKKSSSTSSSSTVWVSRTGTKYHSSSTCSGMKSPSSMTKTEAENQGYSPCSKCY